MLIGAGFQPVSTRELGFQPIYVIFLHEVTNPQCNEAFLNNNEANYWKMIPTF
jgi:hypothetical protein